MHPKRILFIVPPRPGTKRLFLSVQFPVGLGFLMTYLQGLGHTVKLLDYEVEPFSPDTLQKYCRSFRPDVVGLTAMTPQIVQADMVAGVIKQDMPDLLTVVGGKHVSVLPKRSLEQFPHFDCAVFGEGEMTMAELLDNLGDQTALPRIQGLAWRDGADITVNPDRPLIPDLDVIPHPDRSLFDIASYGRGMSFKGMWRTSKMTEIITSRGCPNHCIFCSSQIITKGKVRNRSIPHLIAEMEECRTKYGFTHFRIVDDTFTINRDRVLELCDWFRNQKVTWNCNARVNTVDRDMLLAMRKSGCLGIMYGVESGSQELLKKMRKGITLEQIKNAFRWSHEARIPIIEADFILGGHPDETAEQIALSRELIRKIRPHYLGLGPLVPYPGCEVRDIMIKKGLIDDWALEDWNSYEYTSLRQGWRYTHFSHEEMQALCRDILHDFYYHPRFFFYNLKRIRKLSELTNAVRAGWQFLRFVAGKKH